MSMDPFPSELAIGDMRDFMLDVPDFKGLAQRTFEISPNRFSYELTLIQLSNIRPGKDPNQETFVGINLNTSILYNDVHVDSNPAIYKALMTYKIAGQRVGTFQDISTYSIAYLNVYDKTKPSLYDETRITKDIETVNQIRAVIDSRLKGRGDISSYLIGGRQITTISTDELMRLLRNFEERINYAIKPNRNYYYRTNG